MMFFDQGLVAYLNHFLKKNQSTSESALEEESLEEMKRINSVKSNEWKGIIRKQSWRFLKAV